MRYLRPLAFPPLFALAPAARPFDEPPPLNARPFARAPETLPSLVADIPPALLPGIFADPFEPDREKLLAPSPGDEEPRAAA
jgi:hypothetical protein